MTRILFSWELGSNFGHLAPLIPVARRLRLDGHEVLFAVKDVHIAYRLFERDSFDYVQSPSLSGRAGFIRTPVSYADILADAGFLSSDELSCLVMAWQNLFKLYRPDVLVLNHAPLSMLAARLGGLPCLRIENGFEFPPGVSPFPLFRPWLNVTEKELQTKENMLLSNLNNMCDRSGFTRFTNLRTALRADVSLLNTLPELDHYPGHQGRRYIGPIFIRNDGDDVSWMESEGPRIFVYLRPFQRLSTVLEYLNKSGANVIAFIPGIREELRRSSINGRMRIFTEMVKLTDLLPGADLVIFHAGHGLASAALLAGKPMLVIPTTIEQWMTSRNIERLGLGIGVRQDRIEADFASSFDRMLTDGAYRDKASILANKYSGYDQDATIDRIVATVKRLPDWVRNGDPAKKSYQAQENEGIFCN